MTLPSPQLDPLVRYTRAAGPGDRPALVSALAELLIEVRQRRLAREAMLDEDEKGTTP